MTPPRLKIRRRTPLMLAASACLATVLLLPATAGADGEIFQLSPEKVFINSGTFQLEVDGTFPLQPEPVVCWTDANPPADGPRNLPTEILEQDGDRFHALVVVESGDPGPRRRSSAAARVSAADSRARCSHLRTSCLPVMA